MSIEQLYIFIWIAISVFAGYAVGWIVGNVQALNKLNLAVSEEEATRKLTEIS